MSSRLVLLVGLTALHPLGCDNQRHLNFERYHWGYFITKLLCFLPPDDGERILTVRAMQLHPRFRAGHHDYDLAFLQLTRPLQFSPTIIHLCLPAKDFCEKVLMNSRRTGVTARPRDGRLQEASYVTLDECRAQLKPSHPLSNKMFCMKGNPRPRRENLDAPGPEEGNPEVRSRGNASEVPAQAVSEPCNPLLPGTPVVTVDRGTVFLTGLLTSSPADCGSGGLVFTKLSRHLSWIRPRVKESESLGVTPQVNVYPQPLG